MDLGRRGSSGGRGLLCLIALAFTLLLPVTTFTYTSIMVSGKENRPITSSPLSRHHRRLTPPRSPRPGSPTKPGSPKRSAPSRRTPGGDRHPHQRKRVLVRPETIPIRPEAVAAMLPESLEDVDYHWIRSRLQNKGKPSVVLRYFC